MRIIRVFFTCTGRPLRSCKKINNTRYVVSRVRPVRDACYVPLNFFRSLGRYITTNRRRVVATHSAPLRHMSPPARSLCASCVLLSILLMSLLVACCQASAVFYVWCRFSDLQSLVSSCFFQNVHWSDRSDHDVLCTLLCFVGKRASHAAPRSTPSCPAIR